MTPKQRRLRKIHKSVTSEKDYLVEWGVNTTGDAPLEAAHQAAYFMQKWNDGAEHVFIVTDKKTKQVTRWRAIVVGKGVAWRPD